MRDACPGRNLRILTIVDTHSRYAPATDPRFTYLGEDVVQTLEQVCGQIGYPRTIMVDNGREFVSRDLDLWAYANGITLDFSWPGKPTDNGFIEAINSRFRAECLNAHWFLSLADARESWRIGVETTTRFALKARSDTRPRSRCKFPMAQPVSHRDRSRKTPDPGDPEFGLRALSGRTLTPRGGNAQWQVTCRSLGTRRSRNPSRMSNSQSR